MATDEVYFGWRVGDRCDVHWHHVTGTVRELGDGGYARVEWDDGTEDWVGADVLEVA